MKKLVDLYEEGSFIGELVTNEKSLIPNGNNKDI